MSFYAWQYWQIISFQQLEMYAYAWKTILVQYWYFDSYHHFITSTRCRKLFTELRWTYSEHTHIHTNAHTHTRIHRYTNMHTHTHTHKRTHTHTHMRAHAHTHFIHRHKHAHTLTHTHIHAHSLYLSVCLSHTHSLVTHFPLYEVKLLAKVKLLI